MNDKSVLILPDEHNTWERSTEIRKRYPKNKAIRLGDYFDDWNDTPAIVRKVAEKLKEAVNIPGDEYLEGNHDSHYRWPQFRQVRGSGYEVDKAKAINDVMKFEDWAKLKLFTTCHGWLVSHAGIHPRWFTDPITKLVTIDEIQRQCDQAIMAASMNVRHPVYGVGEARYGPQPVGGIVWMDWNVEFEAIPGINQVVGHTPVRTPQIITGENSINWNIDTKHDASGIKYIGWIHEDGTFTTEKV